jgi:hypothetical protein
VASETQKDIERLIKKHVPKTIRDGIVAALRDRLYRLLLVAAAKLDKP